MVYHWAIERRLYKRGRSGFSWNKTAHFPVPENREMGGVKGKMSGL